VQVLLSAENHQRFCERTALRVLSEADLVLENGSIDGRSDREPAEIDLILPDRGGRLSGIGPRNVDIGPPGASLEERQVMLRLFQPRRSGLVI
jgi:hypothetical protein